MSALNRLVAGSVISAPIYVKWAGASGRIFEFELNTIGTSYQPHSGVYIFCHFGPRNGLVADYLDVAEDFARRIGGDVKSHRHWDEISSAGSTHICTLHVPGGATARVKIERDLRRALMPRKSQMAA